MRSCLIAFWYLLGTSFLLSLLSLGGDDTDRQEKLKAKQEIEKAVKGLESIREDSVVGSIFHHRRPSQFKHENPPALGVAVSPI